MVYVGMICNPQPGSADEEALSKPCDGARYRAGLYDLDALGLQMRRQGAQVGMDAAEAWVALTDGGNGLEGFIDRNFPRAEKVLDFQHGATRLAAFAKPFRPDTSERLLAAWCHTLKHAGGAAMLRVLGRLDRTKMTEEVRKGHDDVLSYLHKNVDRMDYPRYLRNGWRIASGAVESACKTVVNQRLRLGGMRWGEEGSDAVAHLRALYRSDPGTPPGRRRSRTTPPWGRPTCRSPPTASPPVPRTPSRSSSGRGRSPRPPRRPHRARGRWSGRGSRRPRRASAGPTPPSPAAPSGRGRRRPAGGSPVRRPPRSRRVRTAAVPLGVPRGASGRAAG